MAARPGVDPNEEAAPIAGATEPMPWRVQVRLRVLEVAAKTSLVKAISDLEPEADRYYAWVMREKP